MMLINLSIDLGALIPASRQEYTSPDVSLNVRNHPHQTDLALTSANFNQMRQFRETESSSPAPFIQQPLLSCLWGW